MNTSLKKIPILTYFLPQQIQDPNGMKQEAQAHSTGFTSQRQKGKWCKKQRTQERDYPGHCPRLPGNGDARAGVGNQPWHKEVLRVHVRAAHAEGEQSQQFCMQHLVIMKDTKITRFTRLAACNCCTYKCSVSLLRLIQIIQPPWACKPELQVWILAGDLLKDCWCIWPWRNAKKWKSNETHRTFLSPRLCLAWIQWTRLISADSPVTHCYLPKLWSKATARAEDSRAKVSVRVTYSISQKSKIKRATWNTNRMQKLITSFHRRAKDLICNCWLEHVP